MRAFVVVLAMLAAWPAAAQGPGWYYLDRVARRCVPVDIAFPGALTPEEVVDVLNPAVPWRIERLAIPQGRGELAEVVDGRTGRRLAFYSNPVLCADMRAIFLGR